MRSSLIVVALIAGCLDTPEDTGVVAGAAQVCGTSLQAAIDAAPDGEVLEICAGTYRERLVISGKRLELRGTSGAALTIVDADAAGRVLLVQNGASVTVRGLTLRDGSTSSTGGGVACRSSTLAMRDSVVSASRGVAGGGGLGADGCVLDIERTRFESNDADDGRGGGALIVGGSGRVAASTFVGNDAHEGGGVAIEGGTVELADNDVRSNSAHRGGGMLLAYDGRVRGNDIVDNEGRWTGGGIYVDARAPRIEANLVQGNTSVNDGGGFYVHEGPAVIVDNEIVENYTGDDGAGVRLYTCRARLERNVIERNEAADSGGGVRVSHLPALLVDNVIRDNTADRGGGLDLDNDASVLRGGVIARNRASVGGGVAAALYPYDGGVIEDVQLLDNVATSSGGALYVADNYRAVTMRHLVVRGNRAPRGAGLYVRGTAHALHNSVFAGNVATGDGGAIHVASSGGAANLDFLVLYRNSAASGSALYSAASGVSIESSILAENAGTAVRVSSTPTYRYNDTWPRSFSGMSDPTGSNGNLSADPRFVDAAGGNFALGAGSPAIDAGDPALRDVNGTRADMGMFGGPDGADVPPPPPPPPPPDDGVVLEADAHVRADLPGSNFGGNAALEVDGSPLSEAYLRFRVTGAGTVTGARLRLRVTNGTGDAPTLYAAASTWDESTITWNTRPARGAAIADLGAVTAGTVIDYDVSDLVTGDGVYTMALVPTSTDGMDVSSGEGSAPPELILTTDDAPGPSAVVEADTYAAAAAPDTSHGGASMISSDGSPLEEAYVRFRVTGLTAPPTRARLRLVVVDASSDGPAVYLASNSWSESTLTWNNRPARSGGPLADLGAAALGQVVEVDVTGAITADGAYTFALIPTSSSGFGASSREGGSPPALIIEP